VEGLAAAAAAAAADNPAPPDGLASLLNTDCFDLYTHAPNFNKVNLINSLLNRE
jgi:hypothetical protein